MLGSLSGCFRKSRVLPLLSSNIWCFVRSRRRIGSTRSSDKSWKKRQSLISQKTSHSKAHICTWRCLGSRAFVCGWVSKAIELWRIDLKKDRRELTVTYLNTSRRSTMSTQKVGRANSWVSGRKNHLWRSRLVAGGPWKILRARSSHQIRCGATTTWSTLVEVCVLMSAH